MNNPSPEFARVLSRELFPELTEYFRELDDKKRFQIFYSSLGLQMLSSLYDYDEETAPAPATSTNFSVSMSHALNRGKQLVKAYRDLYPKVFPIKSDTDEDSSLVQKIRAIYLKTGHMLHQQERLCPPRENNACWHEIAFMRGTFPWALHGTKISGLGMYKALSPAKSMTNIWGIFHIEDQPIDEWWRIFFKTLHWENRELPEGIEFFQFNRKPAGKYWGNTQSRFINLFRSKSFPRSYGLCQHEEGATWKVCRISAELLSIPSTSALTQAGDHQTTDYMRVAIALMHLQRISYEARIEKGPSISKIHLGQLLPPYEQNLFELYSWPKSTANEMWHRCLRSELLPLFEHILKNLGFDIQEVCHEQ